MTYRAAYSRSRESPSVVFWRLRLFRIWCISALIASLGTLALAEDFAFDPDILLRASHISVISVDYASEENGELVVFGTLIKSLKGFWRGAVAVRISEGDVGLFHKDDVMLILGVEIIGSNRELKIFSKAHRNYGAINSESIHTLIGSSLAAINRANYLIQEIHRNSRDVLLNNFDEYESVRLIISRLHDDEVSFDAFTELLNLPSDFDKFIVQFLYDTKPIPSVTLARRKVVVAGRDQIRPCNTIQKVVVFALQLRRDEYYGNLNDMSTDSQKCASDYVYYTVMSESNGVQIQSHK